MRQNIFLQEMPATVVFFDVRRWSLISSQLGPLDLGVALGRFYRHVEQHVLDNKGRVVKFISDAALALFPSTGDVDHAGHALQLLRALAAATPAWLDENLQMGQPNMEYSVGVATGNVLFGELGTERQRAFDVLGRPVNLAIKLARLATVRATPHLVAEACLRTTEGDVPSIELEGAEVGDQPLRLFRVLTDEEAAAREGGGD
jgi:adenylate cyclase